MKSSGIKLTDDKLVFHFAQGMRVGGSRVVLWDDVYESGYFDRSLHDRVEGPAFVVKWDHERTRGRGTMIVKKEIRVQIFKDGFHIRRLS